MAEISKMEIILRIATMKDSEPISVLSTQLGYNSQHIEIQKRLFEILKNNDNCVFVAVYNETIIGWIHGFYTLRVESDFFTEIGGLVVHDKYRNRGIGKKLVENVIHWSKLKKSDKLRVRCKTIRKESHKFYERIGFTLNKEQKIFDKTLITPPN